MSSFNADIDRLTAYAHRRVRNMAITFIAIAVSISITVCDARANTGDEIQSEFAELVMELPTDKERAEVYAAIDRCAFRTPAHLVDPWAVLALLRLEQRLLIPPEGRGLLPAAWCIEASMRLEAKRGGPILGDFREGRGHISHGPFQMSQSMRDWCGGAPGSRHDLIWSARCWVAHIHRVLPKAEKHCRRRTWVYAEALVANPNSYRGNCAASSKHYKLIGK